MLANTALDAMKAALGGFDDILNTPLVTTVPLLSEILRFAKIDIDTTVGQVLSMLIAFPATLISKVAFKTGLIFPGSPPTAGDLGDDTPNKWGTALSLLSGVTQLIWASVDEFEDTESGVTPRAAVLRLPRQRGPACSTSSAPTFSPSRDGLPRRCRQLRAQPRSVRSPRPGHERDQTAPLHRCRQHHRAHVGGVRVLLENRQQDRGPNSTFNTYFQPFGLIACGVAALVLNHIYLYANNGSSNDKYELVLGNLSNIFAWLGLQVLIDATEGDSLALKIIIDAVANFGAATCMLDDIGHGLRELVPYQATFAPLGFPCRR